MAVRQDASTGQLIDDGKALAADSGMANGKPVMSLKVYSPFHIYFDEKAYTLSAANTTGPFDILPHHHNFISLLSACELHIQAPTGEKRIRISGALMHVKADEVKVFLDV